MNDLPNIASPPISSSPNQPVVAGNTRKSSDEPTSGGAISHGSKETAPVSGMPDQREVLSNASGQEFELPKEVQSAGVRIQPTTIPIPPPIAKLGVSASGANIPVQTTSTVVLPLSDDQIAVGLHQEVTNSMRWLAEWCVRRLKFLHITLKNVHGKFIRVKE